jgi:hypothetical protein
MRTFQLAEAGKVIVTVEETKKVFTLTFTKHCTEELLYEVVKEVAPSIVAGRKDFILAFENDVPYAVQAYGMGVARMLLGDSVN